MITIDNRQLNVTAAQIIQDLRIYLQPLDLHYFKDVKDVGNDIMITCPQHANGQEKRPSCGVRKTDGWVHCFTCGYSKSLSEMISNVLGYEDYGRKGREWLFKNYIQDVVENRPEIILPERYKAAVDNKQYISNTELDKYRWYNDYMWKRGLTPEIVEQFDIGYDKDDDTITFPVNDEKGNCVFIAKRSTKTKFFHYPADVEKPVYALDKIIKQNISTVYVVESFFNCLTLWKWGRPAIALMGASLTDYQKTQLDHTNIRKYILCFDGDNAGRRGAEKFQQKIKNKLISIIDMYDGKDVNDLTLQQFEKLEQKYL